MSEIPELAARAAELLAIQQGCEDTIEMDAESLGSYLKRARRLLIRSKDMRRNARAYEAVQDGDGAGACHANSLMAREQAVRHLNDAAVMFKSLIQATMAEGREGGEYLNPPRILSDYPALVEALKFAGVTWK